MNEIYDFLAGHVPAVVLTVLFVLSAIFEASKIPIHPWRRIGKVLRRMLQAIGDALNSDLREQVCDISGRMERIELRQCVERKQQLRRAILRFSDECRVGVKHLSQITEKLLPENFAFPSA